MSTRPGLRLRPTAAAQAGTGARHTRRQHPRTIRHLVTILHSTSCPTASKEPLMRQRIARLAVAATAAVVATLAVASPAQAADGPAVLNPAHVNKTAGFQQECTGPFNP